MFKLTVDEAHTFYVGTQGWLVHNQTTGGPCGFAQGFWKHIFSGNTTSRAATGAHVQNYSVEIDAWRIAPASDNAFGVAQGGHIWIYDTKTGDMVVKATDTTMFPKNWTAPQIKQYIENQMLNARVQVGTRDTSIATGRANSVQMVYKIDPASSLVQSAYPRMIR